MTKKLVNGQLVDTTAKDDAQAAKDAQDRQDAIGAEKPFMHRHQRADAARQRLGDRSQRGKPRPDIEVIADQLDVVLKQFKMMEDAGQSLHPDLKAKVDEWEAIKTEFPKSPTA